MFQRKSHAQDTFFELENIAVAGGAALGIAATGLHATVQQGGMTKIEWSAASSADLNASDRKGRTRLHVASFAKQREAIPAPIKTGTNLQLTDQQGNTPLQMAISRGYAEMVKMLSVPAPASK